MTTSNQTEVARMITGKVVSTKMNKTIVVQTERKVKHALYGKYIRRFSRMHAHDENQVCREGDTVRIRMCRPISKTKTWVLDGVVTPFNEAEVPVTE